MVQVILYMILRYFAVNTHAAEYMENYRPVYSVFVKKNDI